MAACWGKRPLLWAIPPVWALFLALRLFRVGDTAVPMFFNRPFNLYIDSGYLYGLYDLLKTSSHQGDFLLIALALATVALGVMAAGWYAWQAAARALAVGRMRRLFLGGSGLILGAALIWGWGWSTAGPPVLVRLGREILSIRDQADQRQAFIARLEQAARDRKGRSDLTQRSGGRRCPGVHHRVLWPHRFQPAQLSADHGRHHGPVRRDP